MDSKAWQLAFQPSSQKRPLDQRASLRGEGNASGEDVPSSKLVQTAEGTPHLTFNYSKSSTVKSQEGFSQAWEERVVGRL